MRVSIDTKETNGLVNPHDQNVVVHILPLISTAQQLVETISCSELQTGSHVDDADKYAIIFL